MPPVWLDQIPLRPKAKSEEMDFEKLREAAAQEAERLSAERDKQNRQSSAQTAAVVRRQKGRSSATEKAEPEDEYPARVAALPIKINLLA
jgi:hypothetical protein